MHVGRKNSYPKMERENELEPTQVQQWI